MTRVAVFGGGIGGLTAAHELVERGYEVDIYNVKSVWGGKARSMSRSGTGTNGRKDVPGEHGFRFFPGFYRHVTDTMERIYTDGDAGTAFDALVSSTEVEFLQLDHDPFRFPARFPRSIKEWTQAIWDIKHHQGLGFAPREALHFIWLCVKILCSCKQRRFEQLEYIPWWTYTGAEDHQKQYRKLLAIGLTRSLVAMKAETASTRTVGVIFLQVALDILRPGHTSDRVLNGPTSDVWIDPWVKHLQGQDDVRFHPRHKVLEFKMSGGRISGVVLEGPDGEKKEVVADHYVSALPVDVMTRLLTPAMAEAAPSLANIGKLDVQWMNGIQYYLRKPYPVIHGHTIFSDSSWALTSISQAQFWEGNMADTFGDGCSTFNSPSRNTIL